MLGNCWHGGTGGSASSGSYPGGVGGGIAVLSCDKAQGTGTIMCTGASTNNGGSGVSGGAGGGGVAILMDRSGDVSSSIVLNCNGGTVKYGSGVGGKGSTISGTTITGDFIKL